MKKIFTLSFTALFSTLGIAQSGTQTFTVSGTYTVPAGVTSISIEVVGAGGNGGGNGGGGGGGGGYSSGTFTVTPSSTLAVTVGNSSNGTSTVGMLISATGGGDGTSVSNPNIGGGGAGGVGSGGTINYTGGTGGGGYWTYFGGGGGGAAGASGNGNPGGNTITWTGICQTPGGAAGISGGAPGGNGGKGAGFTDVNCNVSDPAAIGANFGGGGGGGNGNGGAAQNGAGGYVSITWGTTGMQTFASTTKLMVTPNPFSTKISFKNLKGNESFEMINTLGQVIWSGKDIEQKDFSYLNSGAYFVRVFSDNESKVLKIIKE